MDFPYYTRFSSVPEDAIKLEKFLNQIIEGHKDNCPFAKISTEKTKLSMRGNIPHHELQLDYMHFKRASFYIDWEQNFFKNYEAITSTGNSTIIPIIDSQWVARTFKEDELELLWLKQKEARSKDEFDVKISKFVLKTLGSWNYSALWVVLAKWNIFSLRLLLERSLYKYLLLV